MEGTNNFNSTPSFFSFGVFQGLVFGLLSFILYTFELPRIISSFSLQSQRYVDDLLLYFIPKYELYPTMFLKISCIGKIISWSGSMFFKLNPSKFDLIYFSEFFRLIESLLSIDLSSDLSLASIFTIHNLSLISDSSHFLIPKIKSVAKSSFFHHRRIKQLKIFLDNPTLKLLISSLFSSRFDYFKSSYYGLSETTLHLLTKASNGAAR